MTPKIWIREQILLRDDHVPGLEALCPQMLYNTEIAGAGQRAKNSLAWPEVLGWQMRESVLGIGGRLTSGDASGNSKVEVEMLLDQLQDYETF